MRKRLRNISDDLCVDHEGGAEVGIFEDGKEGLIEVVLIMLPIQPIEKCYLVTSNEMEMEIDN